MEINVITATEWITIAANAEDMAKIKKTMVGVVSDGVRADIMGDWLGLDIGPAQVVIETAAGDVVFNKSFNAGQLPAVMSALGPMLSTLFFED
jgi:hypothetical protein